MEENKSNEKKQLDRLKEQFSGKGGNKDSKGKPSNNGGGFNFMWVYGAIFLLFVAMSIFQYVTPQAKSLNYRKLTEYMQSDDVDKIKIINQKDVYVYIKPESLTKPEFKDVGGGKAGETDSPGPQFFIEMPAETFEKRLEQFYEENTALNTAEKRLYPVYEERKNYWSDILAWTFPIIIMVAIWLFIMRRMSGGAGGGPGSQIFNIGKSRAQVYDQDTKVKISFQNVAGLHEAKEEVKEVVDFLKNPKKYTNLGGKIPRGVLLSGPPGTGKTLLAKAVAGEAQVPFYSLSGSDFVEMFVGVGASRVRDLFKQAKDKSPCIIFIDEIDAIGRARGKNSFTGGNDERENTLNQLLTEMDGFGTNEHVIVMAATNRADVLDRALMRAGRFDRIIYVDLPELSERRDIFRVHLKPIKVGTDIDVEFLARQTPGFSGADIANVCNEAALIAARKEKEVVEKQDFLDAVDRIVGGLEKKSKIITKEEKKTIAYHEAGHAAVSWLLEHAAPLVKVTIVPRGRSLGAAWYLPEERQLTNIDQMNDEMCATLGGRAAEEVMFGKISTGALSDLEKVTKQARAMVTIYGLNEKLGNVTYYDSSGQQEYTFDKPYSERTAQIIDEEISTLIETQYKRAKQVLSDNKDKLIELGDKLLEKEVLFKENLEQIFGMRQWEKEEHAFAPEEPEATSESEAKTEKPAENVNSPAENKPETVPSGTTEVN